MHKHFHGIVTVFFIALGAALGILSAVGLLALFGAH